MMKMKRFLAAFLTGVLVLTQTAPALAADGFDAASSDAYYAENEDAYEDELESPDEDQEDLDAVNEDPAGTAMSEGAEAVFDEDGADAETPDEIAEGTGSADGIDPVDDIYVADGIEDGVEEGAEVPDGTEYVEDISADSEPEDVTGEDDVQDGAQDAADAEAEDDAEAPELGAASSGAKAAVYYNFQEDRNVLAGWWGNVDGWRDAWVEDDNGGHNENYKVLDVEIIEGQDLLSEFEEPKSDEEYYWFYRIRNGVMDGTVTFKVTYQKLDNTTDSYELHLYIGSEVWWVDLRSEGEHFQGLPGSNFALYADPHHEYYDSEGEYQRNTDGSYFEWSITDGSEYAEMQQDPDDSFRAALSMKPLPDNVDEADIRVKVRMFFDGEEKGSSEERFTVRNVYDEIWPTDLNRGLDVGASLENVSFTVRRYDKNGTAGEGYNAEHYKELENVTFAWEEFDGNAIQIKDTNGTVLQNNERASGNSFTITRLADWDFGYKIHAFWNEGSEEWDLDRHYWFDGKDYNIWFEEHDVDYWTDSGENPILRLNLGNLGENWQDRLGLETSFGLWDGDADDWKWKAADNNEYFNVAADPANQNIQVLTFDPGKLIAAAEQYNDWNFRVVARVTDQNGNFVKEDQPDAWLNVREAKEEYDKEEDRDVLPGWDGTISGSRGVWIENAQNPYGYDERYFVTKVEIEEGRNLLDEFHPDQNSPDDWYWRVKEDVAGTITFRIYYEDLQGQEQSYTFDVNVVGDVYNVNMDSTDNRHSGIPGETLTFYADASHEYLDENKIYQNDNGRDDSRFSYEWGFEFGSKYGTITSDRDCASLTLKLPENEDNGDGRIFVRVKYDGNEVGYSSTHFDVHNCYDEIWPTDLDKSLDKGASLKDVEFTVHRYDSKGTAAEGYNEDHYKILENVTFAWEGFDSNAVQIKDSKGKVLQENERATGNKFTISRLDEGNTDFKIRAYWNEDGREQDIEQNYRFDWKDYNLNFERDDYDFFEDADSVEVKLDTSNLGDKWQDRYDLTVRAGFRDRDIWEGDVSYSDQDEGNTKTFTFPKSSFTENDFDDYRNVCLKCVLKLKGTDEVLKERDVWIHLKRVEYNYWDDERQFPGNMFFINENEGRPIWVQNSDYPEGRDMHVKVEGVSIDCEESATDSREVAKALYNKEEHGWDIKAIREGDATATLSLKLYEDNLNDPYKIVTDTFNIHVTGFIANIDLQSSSGRFDLMPGEEITIIPESNAEYQDDDGYHEEDVSHNSIRYVFHLDEIDDDWAEQNADGDWKNAFQKTFAEKFWTVSVPGDSKKTLEWNDQEESYSLTIGGANRSIVLASKADIPWMRLHLTAELLSDDPEGVLVETDRWIDLSDSGYEIELAANWKTNLLPGQIAEVNPSLVLYKNGQKDTTFAPEDLTWRMEWQQRSGIDFEEYANSGEIHFNAEWDRQHVLIKDSDGRVFRYDGNQTIESGRAPFQIQRLVEWSTRVELIAEFKENGEPRKIHRTLYFEPVSIKADITPNPDRSGEEKPARFYQGDAASGSGITVEADVSELEKMGAVWTFKAVRGRWDELNNRPQFDPLYTYDLNPDGRRIGSTKREFTFEPSELQGNKLTITGADRFRAIWNALRYEYNEMGDAVTGFEMSLEAELNGLTVVSDRLEVQLSDQLVSLEDDGETTMPGEDFFYKDGKAMLYVEDETHQGGSGDERGDSYEVTITNIEVISEDKSCLVPEKVDGKGWYIRAKKKGEADVKYTFTGGPDGITDHTTRLHVTEAWYYVDVDTERTLYPGGSDKINLKLKKDVYNPTTNEIEYGKDVTGSFDVKYDWDRELLSLNETTGEFTVDMDARLGNTRIVAWVHNLTEDPDFESFEQINVRISTTKAELNIEDTAVFGMVPGETYTIDELKSLLPEQMHVESMKDSVGEDKDIAEYFFDGGRPAVFRFSGPNGADRPWTKVTINEDILDWIEDGAVRPVQILGVSADRDEAVDELNLVIHNHKWSKVTYTWSKDNKTVTAARKCTVNGCTKVEKETVKTTAKVTTPATCTTKGKTTYTATFKNAVFAKQTKVLENIAALGHKWDSGKVTKAATVTATGTKTFTCLHDKTHTKTQVIPKLPNPEGNDNDPTSVAGTAKKIAKVADNAEPEGSSFTTIQLQSKKQTKDSITFAWNSVPGASGYIIFGNACGKANSLERIAKQSGTGYAAKGLKANTYYKYMVAAYQKVGGSEKIIGLSKVAHVTTKGKNTNVSKIKINKKKVTLAKKGKTFKLKATEVKQSKKGKLKRHRKVKYESSDPTVATVDAKGKIKAKKKGKCVIYVYSQNGTYAKVKVTVKK